MKYAKLVCITSIAQLTLLAIPVRVCAQDGHASHHHYQLIDLGTFGGPNSGVSIKPWQNVINSKGTVVGGADTSIPTSEPGRVAQPSDGTPIPGGAPSFAHFAKSWP
jgi:hypothetical protein